MRWLCRFHPFREEVIFAANQNAAIGSLTTIKTNQMEPITTTAAISTVVGYLPKP